MALGGEETSEVRRNKKKEYKGVFTGKTKDVVMWNMAEQLQDLDAKMELSRVTDKKGVRRNFDGDKI